MRGPAELGEGWRGREGGTPSRKNNEHKDPDLGKCVFSKFDWRLLQVKRKRQYEMGLEEGQEIGLAVPTGCNETSPLTSWCSSHWKKEVS